MRRLARHSCTATGCSNDACVVVNDDVLCLQCAQPDLTDEQIHNLTHLPVIQRASTGCPTEEHF